MGHRVRGQRTEDRRQIWDCGLMKGSGRKAHGAREMVKVVKIVDVVYLRGQKSDVGDQLQRCPLTSDFRPPTSDL
jgi:hypothetical protein